MGWPNERVPNTAIPIYRTLVKILRRKRQVYPIILQWSPYIELDS